MTTYLKARRLRSAAGTEGERHGKVSRVVVSRSDGIDLK
jgi:hypothetical protein